MPVSYKLQWVFAIYYGHGYPRAAQLYQVMLVTIVVRK